MSAAWCVPDNCPAAICGGPHHEVETHLGIEVLRADQRPVTGGSTETADRQPTPTAQSQPETP